MEKLGPNKGMVPRTTSTPNSLALSFFTPTPILKPIKNYVIVIITNIYTTTYTTLSVKHFARKGAKQGRGTLSESGLLLVPPTLD